MMRKVQNAISFIVFFIIIISAYSQNNIRGKYVFIDNDYSYSEKFQFYKNGVFTYEEAGDVGISYFGKGHYIVKNDSLILSFDLTEPTVMDYHIQKQYTNDNDSIKVNINIYNLNKKILPNHQISIISRGLNFYSDKNGHLELKFKKEKKDLEIYIPNEYLGYTLNISKNRNHIFNVFIINENKGMAIKDEVKKYNIIEMTDDLIKLKTKDKIIELVKQIE